MAFLLSEETLVLPLPVPLRPSTPGTLDVPEPDIVVNVVGPTVQPRPGEGGQGMEYTEYNNQPTLPHSGRQPNPYVPGMDQALIYVPAPGPNGSRVPKVVHLSDRNIHGFFFPENKTGTPQEAQTQTSISWQPFKQSTAYIVTCQPVTQRNEKMFQVSKPIRRYCFWTYGCIRDIELDEFVHITNCWLNLFCCSCNFLPPPPVPH